MPNEKPAPVIRRNRGGPKETIMKSREYSTIVNPRQGRNRAEPRKAVQR